MLTNEYEIVKCLIRSGANINLANKFKKTPLHLTCQLGNESIANLLLESGSDLNAKDMLQMTPLMWSIERNHDNLVILLCGREDIDLNCLDKFNRTCFDICLNHGNDFIYKVLTNARNKVKEDSLDNSISMSHLEMLIDENSTSNMDTLDVQNVQPTTSGLKFVNKSKTVLLLDELDNDSDDSDNEFLYSETKKKRFSFSPIQNAEETLFWLKKQAISNSNEYLLNCELSLTG